MTFVPTSSGQASGFVVQTTGAPPFDAFVLDPGPRITAIEAGLFDRFDARKLPNADKLPAGFTDEWGMVVNAQVVGIAYNPKKVPAPKGWKDLFSDPWVSRLGLTGFQTTFGTVSLIEIAKVFGGSETNIEPALVELKKVLPKIAAVGQPAQVGRHDHRLAVHRQDLGRELIGLDDQDVRS